MDNKNQPSELIVTIVNKGQADKVIEASNKTGGQGGTVIPGRGCGAQNNPKLFGIPIEPEKDIVFILIEKEKTQKVLNAITEKLDLCKPGAGISFVIPVSQSIGILFNEFFRE